MPGNSHLVQNDFGGAVGGPAFGKKTFFFANYEGSGRRRRGAPWTPSRRPPKPGGDFSQSGVAIYDPNSHYAIRNYNAALPISATKSAGPAATSFQVAFIPASAMNPAAVLMLKSYVPAP